MKRRKWHDESVDFEKTWELGWWRRGFRRLRNEPRFCAVVTLARAVNVLRFVQCVVVDLKETASPSGRRQMMNAFYLSGASLVEVGELVGAIGRHFRDVPEYRDGLSRAVNSDEFREVEGRFRVLRNRSSFHFDERAAREVLCLRGGPFERFLSARGTLNAGYYYDLGDIVAFDLLVGQAESPEALEASVRDFLSKTAQVTNQVLTTADNFIGSQLKRWSPVIRQLDEPSASP